MEVKFHFRTEVKINVQQRSKKMNYRHKQTLIQAIIWTGSNFDVLVEKFGKNFLFLDGNGALMVTTKNGTVGAVKGDYIVKDAKGELYPVNADTFLDSYLPDNEIGEGNDVTAADEIALQNMTIALRALKQVIKSL